MNSVIFGNKNSFDDWNIALIQKKISLPRPKTSKINLEGSDGYIDLSEVLCGEIKFDNRSIAFEFEMLDDYSNFHDKTREIANYLQGRKLKIILTDDPNYYYIGRCTIDDWSSDKRIGKIVIKCDCEPWKYSLEETVLTRNINGTETIEIVGKRKTVSPIFKITSDMNITFNGVEYLAPAGEYVVWEIQIKEGLNRFVISGNGTITIKYQEGEL